MNVGTLHPTILDVAKAVGLVDGSGDLDLDWFGHPLAKLRSILVDDAQRAAFVDLLDRVAPSDAATAPTGEKWHPLLGANPHGNVYVTVRDDGGSLMFGIGVRYATAGTAPAAGLRLAIPCVRISAGGSFAPVTGTAENPLAADLRVEIGLTRPADPIGLRAVTIGIVLAPQAAPPFERLRIVLERLDVDGSGPRDRELAADHLDADVATLIVGLIRAKLATLAAATGEAASVATHLLPLLGFTDGIPPFPLADALADRAALQRWLAALAHDAAAMQTWLAHLAGLLGATSVATGSGIPADPWRVALNAPAASTALALRIDRMTSGGGTPNLRFGFSFGVVPAGPNPAVRLEADAVLCAVPLSGTSAPLVLPEATLALRSPGDGGTMLVTGPAPLRAGALRAGVRWNAAALTPLLELLDVTFGSHYDVVDLTNADSVAQVASSGVRDTIVSALGNAGAGPHLAALASLIPPASDPAWPAAQLADPALLVASPAAAIAKAHRATLLDATHGWGSLFIELAALLGVAGPVQGSGTPDDPWRATLGASGPVHIDLVAWNAQTSGNAADPQLLRLGMQCSFAAAPWTGRWRSDILGVDLPASGSASLRLLNAHVARITLDMPSVDASGGIALAADRAQLDLTARNGVGVGAALALTNLRVSVDATTITVPHLVFPTTQTIDPANPLPTLGVSAGDLTALVRALLARALGEAFGAAGVALGVVLGLNSAAPGISKTMPLLGGNGALPPDLAGAWRTWLRSVADGYATDGTPFAAGVGAWLGALTGDGLPADGNTAPPQSLDGTGTWRDPWRFPLGSSPAALLAWLEPDGPTHRTPAEAASQIAAAADFPTLIDALAGAARYLPGEPLAGRDIGELAAACVALDALFAHGDGAVLAAQQVPSGGTWTAGATVHAAHERVPKDPAAIGAVLAQLTAWSSGDRVVLLLAPPYLDHSAWDALLAAAESARPGRTSALAHFNFRLGTVAPGAIDLRTVSVAVDYYTADLHDDGTGNATLVDQIDRVVARLNELRPGTSVTLVAHSTIGLAARAYTAAHPARVRGLITLATPHLGAALDPIVNPALADALRFLSDVAPALAPGPVADALGDLRAAADDALPPATPGALPIARPYPVGSFAGDGSSDTGGVPAVAIVSTLTGTVFDAARAAIVKAVGAATAVPPTHLGFGVDVTPEMPAATSDLLATTALRIDAGRIALRAGAAEPARGPHGLRITTRLERAGGWLAGSPSAHAGSGGNVRVRRAELGVAFAFEGGKATATMIADLSDAALLGMTVPLVRYGDPPCDALLGVVLGAVTSPAPDPASPLDIWTRSLAAIGLVTSGPSGTMLLGIDGIRAMLLDPAGYFNAKLPAALAAGNAWFGARAAPGGCTFAVPGAPFELFVRNSPAAIALRTVDPGWTPAPGITVRFALEPALPALVPTFDATLQLGTATVRCSAGSIAVDVAPGIAGINLVPPHAPAALAAILSTLVPRLLVTTAATAFLDKLVGPDRRVVGLDAWLAAPVAALVRATALGDGTHFSSARIDGFFKTIAGTLGMPPGSNPKLGPFELSAGGVEPVLLSLRTVAPIGGVLAVDLGVAIEGAAHASTTGSLSLHTGLGGTWPGITIAFGVTGGNIAVTVTPDGGTPIQLVPTFSGLGSLRGAATALLPAVLDAVVAARGAATPFVGLALDVAKALDLYDAAGGFAAHTTQLHAMLAPGWLGAIGAAARNAASGAIAALVTSPASPLHARFPGTVSLAPPSTVHWEFASGTLGKLTATMGWDVAGATFTAGVANLELGGGAVVANASAGFAGGAPSLHVDAAMKLKAALGIDVRPQVVIDGSATALKVTFVPLGAGTQSELALQFLPIVALTALPQAAGGVARKIAVPIALDVVAGKASGALARPMWSGGPSVEQMLKTAGILSPGGQPQIPSSLTGVIAAALGGIAAAIDIQVVPGLHLKGASGDGAGLRLNGAIELPGDAVTLVVLFGASGGIPEADGVTLRVFNGAGAFAPRLEIAGFGVGLKHGGDQPLLNLDSFRLGGLDALAFMTIDLKTAAVSAFGAGVELDKLGLPLGLLGLSSGSNPVASSLLDHNAGSGDPHPVNPAVDIVAAVREGSPPLLRFAGQDGARAVPIPIHQRFGPIYIGQLELAAPNNAISLGIDGSVKLDGITVGVEDLGVLIPLNKILRPGDWSLHLAGLAVDYSGGPLKIAGGLRENPLPSGTEYDGMLEINVAGKGFTAIGGYARPTDAQGGYTSLFIFVSLPIPLGGPPFLFIMGLGAGFGYNRDLIIPEDLTKIDSFVLVEAINNDLDANDPMNALISMGQQIPPKRGEYWIAAGLRFTTFALVNSRVIVAVAFGDGFEVNVLGISRMALPTEDVAIASIELALRARYSSAEELLSVQATLTDNCYLFSHDCQLTGGFAFFMWFGNGQFVLTLGGYHPAFRHPANFPDVPRLGFHWHISDIISVKGEAYFALTNTAVMAGARLEASVDLSIIKAWFTAYMDVLVSWDPFYYAFDIGVEVGFTVEVKICFFGCVHLKLTLKKGAQLELSGPPLHGTVTFEAYVTDVTVPFGPQAKQENFITDFNVFSAKYLTAGDPDATGVDVHLSDGILPSDPPGAQPLPGTREQPWKVGAGFAFSTETRMPATTCALNLLGHFSTTPPSAGKIDIAPMEELSVTSAHAIWIDPVDPTTDTSWYEADHFSLAAQPKPFPEGTWMYFDQIPARSGNITAYGGALLIAQSVAEGQSALIPIASLVDDEESLSKPLPLSGGINVASFVALGLTAEALAFSVAGASSATATSAASKLLSGNGVFSAARAAIGVAAGGLSPLADAALRTDRSAPPLLTPLSTGLSRKPVALPAPPPIVAAQPDPAKTAGLRLRAALQHPLTATTGLLPAPHTTARAVSQPRAPRMAPPQPASLVGARLHVVPPLNAPAATKAALDVRIVRHHESGALVAPALRTALERTAHDAVAGGVIVVAGMTHLWDVPSAATVLTVEGDSARVTCLDRAGRVLGDDEYQGAATPALHPETASVAVTCLGAVPTVHAPATRGLYVSAAFGTPARPSGAGWQNANVIAQIGAASYLARASSVRQIRPTTTRRNRQRATLGMIRAADALRGQNAVETRLPIETEVVMVLLDASDGAAFSAGDFAIGATGVTLVGPIPVTGALRRALIYDVTGVDADHDALYVSIASNSAWQVSGTIGLRGRALEWAARLDGSIPDDLTADGPLAPHGAVTVRFTPTTGAPA